MKVSNGWPSRSADVVNMPTLRQRPSSKRPLWIIILICLVSLTLIWAYIYPPKRFSACYFLSSNVCSPFKDWLPPEPERNYTDDELVAKVVVRDILAMPSVQAKNPKIAFMFLTPGSLPFERLWEKFFLGHEDRFSIYIHASREKPFHVSPLFNGREIRSGK